jgi:hypothetical protein
MIASRRIAMSPGLNSIEMTNARPLGGQDAKTGLDAELAGSWRLAAGAWPCKADWIKGMLTIGSTTGRPE